MKSTRTAWGRTVRRVGRRPAAVDQSVGPATIESAPAAADTVGIRGARSQRSLEALAVLVVVWSPPIAMPVLRLVRPICRRPRAAPLPTGRRVDAHLRGVLNLKGHRVCVRAAVLQVDDMNTLYSLSAFVAERFSCMMPTNLENKSFFMYGRLPAPKTLTSQTNLPAKQRLAQEQRLLSSLSHTSEFPTLPPSGRHRLASPRARVTA